MRRSNARMSFVQRIGFILVLLVLATRTSHSFTLRQATTSASRLSVLKGAKFAETTTSRKDTQEEKKALPNNNMNTKTRNKKRSSFKKPNKNDYKKKTRDNVSDSSNNTNNNNNNKESLITRGPWLATFETSRQTQERLQSAGRTRGHALRRATLVLQTLLDHTPVEHANAANLVCALTLSAKLRGTTDHGGQQRSSYNNNNNKTNDASTEQLRRYLWRAIGVLRELIAKNQLSSRQLCNAAWALAKHYDRDADLLPRPTRPTALSTDTQVGTAEEWSLTTHDDDDDDDWETANEASGAPQMVDRVVDELALNLANKLQHDPWIAKHGELCMACWAYGVLRERRRPAGWKLLPQVGNAVGIPQAKKANKSASNLMTSVAVRFEQWQGPLGGGGGSQQYQGGEECLEFDPPGPTDQLLDQIALSLCQPATPDIPSSSTKQDTPMRLQMCQWNELSHVAWAHASHGWQCSEAAEEVLLAVAAEAARRLQNPSKGQKPPLSRDMAQLVWSLGVLQADNFRVTSGLMQLLDGVAAFTKFPNPQVERPFASWSCPDIVQIPLALAHARVDDQDLLRAMYSEATQRMATSSTDGGPGHRNLHAWEVSILLWAQARLHLTESEGGIFDEFPDVAMDFLLSSAKNEGGWSAIGIGAQEQANLIWSLAVLDKFRTNKSTKLLRELFLASQEECHETGIIQLEHAHQLWQALYLLESEALGAVEGIEPWFRSTLEAKWLQEKARPKVSSARHRALSKVLSDMGVAHFNEHEEDIDVAIILKRAASWTHETDRMSLDGGMRVAVEFDGPNHFTRILDTSSRDAPRPLGHSILKYRILKQQGWTVVRVPYYEFDRIPFWASMERQRYVQRLLKTHADLKFSSVDVSEYKPPVANRRSRFQ